MAGLITAKIYGTNILYDFDFADKTTIEAFADVQSFAIDTTGLWHGETNENTKIGLTGRGTVNTSNITYNPKSLPIHYNDANLNTVLQSIERVWNKKYHWIDIGNYPVKPIGYTAGKLISVNFESKSPSWGEDGYMSYELSLRVV